MKLNWLKDFEKRFIKYMFTGFAWAVFWILIMGATIYLFGNYEKVEIGLNIFGAIMIIGFAYFQGYGLVILAKGLFLEIKKDALPDKGDGKK